MKPMFQMFQSGFHSQFIIIYLQNQHCIEWMCKSGKYLPHLNEQQTPNKSKCKKDFKMKYSMRYENSAGHLTFGLEDRLGFQTWLQVFRKQRNWNICVQILMFKLFNLEWTLKVVAEIFTLVFSQYIPTFELTSAWHQNFCLKIINITFNLHICI